MTNFIDMEKELPKSQAFASKEEVAKFIKVLLENGEIKDFYITSEPKTVRINDDPLPVLLGFNVTIRYYQNVK